MMPPTRRSAGPDQGLRGFTLLELMVAFAIFALLAAVVFAGLSLASNSYVAAQERMEQQARERILGEYMKRQLGSLFPLIPTGGYTQEIVDSEAAGEVALTGQNLSPLFAGTRRTVTFLTVAPLMHLRNPGLTVVVYGRAEDEWGEEYLGAMEGPFYGVESFNHMADLPEGKPLPIVEGVRDIRFSYYGFNPEYGDYGWFEEWDGIAMNGVPLAVRVEFGDRYISVPVNAVDFGGGGRRSRLLGVTAVRQDRGN